MKDKPASYRSREQGFTLIEVVVAAMLITTASLVAFPTVLSFFDLSKTAKELNIATHDLQAATEDILATPFSQITSTYTDGQPIPKYRGLHLNQEVILISYADPLADPLEVTLEVQWLNFRGRLQNSQTRILRTQ